MTPHIAKRGCAALLLLLTACTSSSPEPTIPNDQPLLDTGDGEVRVWVTPTRVIAGTHVGSGDSPPLSIHVRLPSGLQGGGMPLSLYGPQADRSVLQIEMPVFGIELSDENRRSASTFSPPRLCAAETDCDSRTLDGFWKAEQRRDGAVLRELQLALPITDVDDPQAATRNVLGVWLREGDAVPASDEIVLSYHGPLPDRATTWTPLAPRVRWRRGVQDDCHAGNRDCWTEASDAAITPLHIEPGAPSYLHVSAPLDTQAGVPFEVTVTALDAYANPTPIRGDVRLSEQDAPITFTDQWQRRIERTYATAGPHRIAASLEAKPDLQPIAQWTMTHEARPTLRRRTGDLHFHTGDGGAQRKFLGFFKAGDHAGLFTSIRDSFRYLDEVAGHDFGAASEHAMRDDGFQPKDDVVTHPAFQPGGACFGAMSAVTELEGWWRHAQRMSQTADGGHDGDFTVFPAFEWQSHHAITDRSPLHRVVLFRDFSADHDLPLLPADIPELDPHCLLAFLQAAGAGPEEALVLPHMQLANDGNIDWYLTYRESDDPLVSRDVVESYQRLAEIFSARSYIDEDDARVPRPGLFEGSATDPAPYSMRYAWREASAHIGVMAASDNHMSAPGADDPKASDGSRYGWGEAGGITVALQEEVSRDGIWDALSARRTYATTGPRFWLDWTLDGVSMGSDIRREDDSLISELTVLVELPIQRVEVVGTRVGDNSQPYVAFGSWEPRAESHSISWAIENPCEPGEAQEWIYYARVLASDEPNNLLEAETAWSSPIWIHWTAPAAEGSTAGG